MLISCLKDGKLIQQGTKINFYRIRDEEFLPLLDEQPHLLFCKKIPGVLMKLGFKEYIPDNWRVFIGGSKRSLKCTLFNITNVFGSIQIRNCTNLKKKYTPVKTALQHSHKKRKVVWKHGPYC